MDNFEGPKMAKPRLAWYTADQLAKEWANYGIQKEEIDHYLENGLLKRWKRFASSTTDKDVFLQAPPFDWNDKDDDTELLNSHRDLYVVFENLERLDYIMLEEVERFENQHGLVLEGNVVKSETQQKVDEVEAQGEDGYVKTIKNLEMAFGWSINLIKAKAKEFEIPIKHCKNTNQLMMKSTDIVKLRSLYKKHSRE